MKVSVVITVFNKEKSLFDSIHSAINQTYKELEIIVVNDGSTDQSLQQILNICNEQPQVILINQENQGLSGARNSGLRTARGDYVLFHDGDDILEINAVKDLMKYAEQYKSDVVGGIFRKAGKEGEKVVSVFQEELVNIDFSVNEKAAKKYCTNFSSCNKIFRRQFLIDNKLEFTPGLYMQDIELWMKCMFSSKKITQIPVVVSNYFYDEKSSSRSKTLARFNSLFDLYENLSKYYQDNGLQAHQRNFIHAWMQGALTFFLKWKVQEYAINGVTRDLNRIRDLIANIPDNELFEYVKSRMNSSVGFIAIVIKYEDYELAVEIQNQYGRNMRPKRESILAVQKPKDLVGILQNWIYGGIIQKKYKIVIFAGGDLHSIGGLQRSYTFLTGRLVELGYQVSIVGWGSRGKRAKLAYPLDSKIEIQYIQRERNQENYLKIKDYLSSINPDIVLIINSGRYAAFVANICIMLELPYVQSIRGSTEYCIRYLWPDVRLIVSVFKCAISKHVLMDSYKNIFLEKGIDDIIAIPSQIEPAKNFADTQLPTESGRYIILYSGRFSVEKRIHYLIIAFKGLSDKYVNWDLWLFGVGPLEGYLVELVRQNGLESRVKFGKASNTDEMYKIYPQAHIKVLPSEQEGCPMALREAMSHGLPVIAYRECSGANEIIVNDSNGLLVDNSNDPADALSLAIVKLIESDSLRKRIGDAARITASEYDPGKINSRWERLIRDGILKNKAGILHHENDNEKNLIFQYAELQDTSDSYRFDLDEVIFTKFKTDYLICYGRRLFDVEYYLVNNLDVKIAGVDPLLHYISQGWLLGLNPSPLFNTNQYINKYMSTEITCPLVHFYKYGFSQGIFPVVLDMEYFEKWPNRRQKNPYNINNDFLMFQQNNESLK